MPDIDEAVETALRHHQNGHLQQAKEQYQLILRTAPANPAALYSSGLIAFQTGEYEQAVVLISQAIKNKPQVPQFYNALGVVFKALGKPQKAIDAYRQALSIQSVYPQAYYNLANVLRDQGRYQEAVENYKNTININPDNVKAYNNLAGTLKKQNNLTEAMIYSERAIQLDPDNAEAYYNLATILGDQGRCSEAIDYYNQAIQLKPDYAEAHLNLSLALLLFGRFEEGWSQYEWRRKTKLNSSFYQRTPEKLIWDGSSFVGKRLFVQCEQGLGDTLQFIRYLPMVKARGGTVIFELWHPLINLLHEFDGIDKFVVLSPDKPDVKFDFYISLMDLPAIFRTTLDSIPDSVPYVYADSTKADYWRARLDGPDFKVGIVWAGSAKHENNHNRSCKLKHFAPLASIDGVRLYSLQKDASATQLRQFPAGKVLANPAEEFEDFTDTAAVIENLDLIISVDTAIVHLAGAMGKPVWTLLPFAPDWRWMLERDDNPWYPTMRLFRQEKWGDWETVFASVAEQLRILTETHIAEKSLTTKAG
ncbi:MAG: tetratricopeptide repeat protein [Planctomycetes bacterium]|nr:tetratricopeptide repeat protein [Planctomycetota bacterium]